MGNKSRILFLLDYLRRNTDEETPVSAAQLRREFRVHGMNAEEPRQPVPKDLKLEDNSDKIFSMFDGPEAEITLRFRPKLLDQIVDRFGAKLELKNINEETIDVTVTVHLSPTFYAWLFQYAGEMKIVEPEGIREEYAERLQAALDDTLGE